MFLIFDCHASAHQKQTLMLNKYDLSKDKMIVLQGKKNQARSLPESKKSSEYKHLFMQQHSDAKHTSESSGSSACHIHLKFIGFLFVGSPDFSAMSTEEVVPTLQETSIKRLVVGPLDVRLHSSAIHRILKMVTCAMDHEYEPYCKPQRGQTSHSFCFVRSLFWYVLFCQWSESATVRTLQHHHHIVISFHNPSFNTQLDMKVVTFWNTRGRLS